MSRDESFNDDLEKICDVDTLVLLKEQIKNQVVDSSITWHERMELYRKIRSINERISQLEETPFK